MREEPNKKAEITSAEVSFGLTCVGTLTLFSDVTLSGRYSSFSQVVLADPSKSDDLNTNLLGCEYRAGRTP